jgi:hypothetical protein
VLLVSLLFWGKLILILTITELLGGIVARVFIYRTGSYVKLIYIGVIIMVIDSVLYFFLSPKTILPQIIVFQLVAGSEIRLVFETPLIATHAM